MESNDIRSTRYEMSNNVLKNDVYGCVCNETLLFWVGSEMLPPVFSPTYLRFLISLMGSNRFPF